MGFKLKNITKSVSKAVSSVGNKVIKPVVKDAIPLTAAYFTGGASAQFLPPTHVGERLGKMTGVPLNTIFGVGGAQNGQVVEDAITPPVQAQSQSSIYDQVSSYWPFSQQTNTLDTAPNARAFDSQPVQVAPQRSFKIPLIIGGVVALLGGLFFILRKRK